MIRQDKKTRLFWNRALPWVIYFLIATLIIAAGIKLRTHNNNKLFCDAEKIEEKDGQVFFKTKNGLFRNGQSQTAEESHSGKFSSKVWKDFEYGMGYHISNVKPGDVYEISVWRKSEANWGQLTIEGSWGLMKLITSSGVSKPGAWEELKTEITVPAWVEFGELKVYCFNNRETPAFFDDLSILKRSSNEHHHFPEFKGDTVPVINLIVGKVEMEKLKMKREEAMRTGVLFTGEKDWVNALLETNEGSLNGKIRLKGDWTDHLEGDKWSFRITLDSGKVWKRMVSFSLHNPETRHFLDEWVFHQLLASEDVLTTRYGFVNVKLNGKNLGIYAWEEHFTKELIEYNHRKEGPILKFNEEGYWNIEARQQTSGVNFIDRTSVAEASTIDAFGMKGIRNDSLMSEQFQIAENLLWEYKTGKRKPSEVFDLDKMAKFFAVVDIAQAQHAVIWHNQRFYFNPVTMKLEPIGFDAYTAEGSFNWIRRPFLGHARHLEYMSPDFREHIFEPLLLDSAFLDLYIGYLNKFTKPEYLEGLFRSLLPELRIWETALCAEFRNYWYEPRALFYSATEIHFALQPGKESSVKAWTLNAHSGEQIVQVENYHCLPVILSGFGVDHDEITQPIANCGYIPAFSGNLPADHRQIVAPSKANYIFFKIPGLDSVYSTRIYKWPPPGPTGTPEEKLFANLEIKTNSVYEVDGKNISFRTGMHSIDHPLIFPAGYQLIIEAGTTLDFVNHSFLLSKSPIVIKGEEENQVKIFSSDQSAMGFSFLQPKGKSILHHVVFEGLGSLSVDGWHLTGAVNFYEADLSMDHCSFIHNHCEDGINIIRSRFSMDRCWFSNISGDGLDVDFSQGSVSNSSFSKTGNDGMDFSGSVVTITDCHEDHNGDKGVSVGEESNVSIENLWIENSASGIVSKDLSKANLKNITLKDVKVGFNLFQKKPEYGPASMNIIGYKAERVGELFLVQKGSTLTINGEIIKGNH